MEIEAPIKKVLKLFQDLEFQLDINTRLKSLDLVEQVTPTATITHQVSKSFFIINGREFYTFANKYDLSKKFTIVSNHSVENGNFDYINKVVRGKVKGIFVFEYLNSALTKITNVLNVNLKGKIPAFISNKMADAQYDSFALLKRRIEEDYHSE